MSSVSTQPRETDRGTSDVSTSDMAARGDGARSASGNQRDLEQHSSRSWARITARHRRPKGLARALRVRQSNFLLWGFETEAAFGSNVDTESVRELRRLMESASGRCHELPVHWQEWLQDSLTDFEASAGRQIDVRAALLWLVATQLVTRKPMRSNPRQCEEITRSLLRVAEQSRFAGPASSVVTAQLIAVELPISLGYYFPQWNEATRAARQARKRFRESVRDLIDEEGVPAGCPPEQIPALLACWTRSLAMLQHCEGKRPSKDLSKGISSCVRFVLNWLRPDGSSPWESKGTRKLRPSRRECLRAAVHVCRDRTTRRIWQQFKAPPAWQGTNHRRPGKPMIHSEAAHIALLGLGAPNVFPKLVVDYSSPTLRVEVTRGKAIVLSGQWPLALWRAGVPIESKWHWRELFTYSDADVDVLELEVKLPDGCSLQRQFVMARRDEFLYVADTVFAEEEAPLELIGTVPLGPGSWLQPEEETRDACIRGPRRFARVLPLAAPEWRKEPSSMEFDDSIGFSVRQSAMGQILYCPLFIDLRKRRMRSPLTWRRLTVAQSRRRTPDQEAVAYRIQVGSEQWMVYRSFTRTGNRSALGVNVASEFYLGRFLSDGTPETIIEVELDGEACPPRGDGALH